MWEFKGRTLSRSVYLLRAPLPSPLYFFFLPPPPPSVSPNGGGLGQVLLLVLLLGCVGVLASGPVVSHGAAASTRPSRRPDRKHAWWWKWARRFSSGPGYGWLHRRRLLLMLLRCPPLSWRWRRWRRLWVSRGCDADDCELACPGIGGSVSRVLEHCFKDIRCRTA